MADLLPDEAMLGNDPFFEFNKPRRYPDTKRLATAFDLSVQFALKSDDLGRDVLHALGH